MTTRRGFLGAILASGAAPALVRYGSLMPVRLLEPVVPLGLVVPERSFLLSVPAVRQPGTTIVRTIGPGGDYATLQAWEDAVPSHPDQRWEGRFVPGYDAILQRFK